MASMRRSIVYPRTHLSTVVEEEESLLVPYGSWELFAIQDPSGAAKLSKVTEKLKIDMYRQGFNFAALEGEQDEERTNEEKNGWQGA